MQYINFEKVKTVFLKFKARALFNTSNREEHTKYVESKFIGLILSA